MRLELTFLIRQCRSARFWLPSSFIRRSTSRCASSSAAATPSGSSPSSPERFIYRRRSSTSCLPVSSKPSSRRPCESLCSLRGFSPALILIPGSRQALERRCASSVFRTTGRGLSSLSDPSHGSCSPAEKRAFSDIPPKVCQLSQAFGERFGLLHPSQPHAHHLLAARFQPTLSFSRCQSALRCSC